MYGLGTVGGAELDTWKQWESLQHRYMYMSTMEPGRAVCELSTYYEVLLIEYIVASHFSVCQPRVQINASTLIYTHYRMFINAHLV